MARAQRRERYVLQSHACFLSLCFQVPRDGREAPPPSLSFVFVEQSRFRATLSLYASACSSGLQSCSQFCSCACIGLGHTYGDDSQWSFYDLLTADKDHEVMCIWPEMLRACVCVCVLKVTRIVCCASVLLDSQLCAAHMRVCVCVCFEYEACMTECVTK